MFHTYPNSGVPGFTTRVASGDLAGNLSTIFTNASGRPAIGAIITCEDNDIRFTLGGNIATPTNQPTIGATAVGHLLVKGQSFSLVSGSQVRTFQFINASQQDNAVLQVTPFFEGR